MRDRVVAVISRVLNVPVAELNNTSSPDTIKNWDSLKHMALILALEEELQVAFSDDE
ncbi:MAG: acyl carrier protein, partial [Lentisphaerae bacterium]|nr:acyl carrier protein [Lentisphaerota bacterium]